MSLCNLLVGRAPQLSFVYVCVQWWGATASRSPFRGLAMESGVATSVPDDDTRAIQMALDAAAPASVADYNLRAPVLLSHGIYTVSSTLWLEDGANVVGEDATLKGAVGVNSAMLAPRKANVSRTDAWYLKGLRLDGLGSSESGVGLWFSMTNCEFGIACSR
eukprot:SAG31_NODE_7298_length_1728_cov_0.893800_2_plen_162_part_00